VGLQTGVARAAQTQVLLDLRPSETKVLLRRTESAEAKLTGTDPPAMVDALKAALVAVLGESELAIAHPVTRAPHGPMVRAEPRRPAPGPFSCAPRGDQRYRRRMRAWP
jgi:hypothetical protein